MTTITKLFNATDFLAKNKLVSCKELAEMLDVSINTITKMKRDPSKVQSLALRRLHDELGEEQRIYLYTTDYHNGGSYCFSGWIEWKGASYFIEGAGYGSHAEDVAHRRMVEWGLLPINASKWELSNHYNIKFRRTTDEVSRKREMYDANTPR